MKFVVTGEVEFATEKRKFSKKVEAATEKLARERAQAELGSAHRVPRSRILIKEVRKI